MVQPALTGGGRGGVDVETSAIQQLSAGADVGDRGPHTSSEVQIASGSTGDG